MQDVTLKNGWLFPGDKVSYNNTPIINLSSSKGIQYYENSIPDTKSNNKNEVEKRKSHFITFDEDNKLRWYYQYEKDCIHDFKMIQGWIKHESRERLSI